MPRTSRLESPMPWYRWYASRWRLDRHYQRLSLAEKGLLRELLDECYLEGSFPADPIALVEFLGGELGAIKEMLPRVLPWFELSGQDQYSSPDIEEARIEQDEYRQRQAERRMGKKSGKGTTTVNRGSGGEEKRENKNKDQQKARLAPANLVGASELYRTFLLQLGGAAGESEET